MPLSGERGAHEGYLMNLLARIGLAGVGGVGALAFVGCKDKEDGASPDTIANNRVDDYDRNSDGSLDLGTESFRVDEWTQMLCTSYGQNGVCNVYIPIQHEDEYNIGALLRDADQYGSGDRPGFGDGTVDAREMAAMIGEKFDADGDNTIAEAEFERFDDTYGERDGRG
jgi:hypothetical protein